MLRRLGVFLGLVLSFVVWQQKALATEVNSINYDIYVGDVDGDGYKDFYFRGKPLWIVLFGDISIPLQLNLNSDFIVYGANGTYSVPVASPLSATSFVTQVSNGNLVLAQNNQDYFIVSGISSGQTNILLRGTDVSKPAIMLASFNSTTLPLITQIYSTTAFPGISDRNFTITMRDINNDGIADLVIEDTTSGATYGGVKTAYISDSSGTPIGFRELRPTSAAPSVPSGASYVGTTSGQFRVDESGAATYSISIAGADGIAGVKPQIELNYSSAAGNGIAGRGWSLSGLSSISRCRQTLSQDNNPQPITWSATDRFCLDGQRLILVSGTYGSAGSTYKTEIDSVIEVKAVGGSAGHPAYFEVKAKDGSLTTYGGTTDSKSSGSSNAASTTILNWARSRFEDNMHNAIEYMYEGDAATGQRIKAIYYAYKTISQSTRGASEAQAKLEFNYEDKTDRSTTYVAGYLFGQTKRLKSIKVFNSDSNSALTELRTYTLNYINVAADANDNRGIKDISRLAWLQECRGNACLAPTQFDWGGGTKINYPTAISKFSFGESENTQSILRKVFADVTGDGKQDLVYVTTLANDNTRVELKVRTDDSGSSGTSTFIAAFNVNDLNNVDIRGLDYNADGRQDIAFFSGLKWYLFLSVPSTTGVWSLQSQEFDVTLNEKDTNFVDVNSDGLVDVVTQYGYRLLEVDPTKTVSSSRYYKFGALISPTLNSNNIYSEFLTSYQPTKSSIQSSSCILQPGLQFKLDTNSLADFNGDGVADFVATLTQTFKCQDSSIQNYDPTVYQYRSAKYAFITRGTELIKFNGNAISSSISNTNANKDQFMDLNGDGLTDHVMNYGNLYSYRLNNGNGFDVVKNWYSLPVYADEPKQTTPQFTDFNGDGLMDLLWVDRSTGKLRALLWGAQTPIDIASVGGGAGQQFIIVDVSGDGVGDLVEFGSRTIYAHYGRYLVDAPCVTYTSSYGSYCAPAAGYDDSKQNLNITAIINGTGAATQIHYGTLSNSGRYTTMDVDGTPATGGANDGQCFKNSDGFVIYCTSGSLYSYMDTTSFYSRLNGGWQLPTGSATLSSANDNKGKPVLEVNGPMTIVTSVESSAPTAGAAAYAVNQSAMSKVDYYYGDAKMQASGRGFLGFGRLQTVDAQTGVTTVTQYRQDFPFIGSPLSTTVYSGDAASSKMLSYALNKWNFKPKSGADGTKYYLPYLEQSTEKTYDADSASNPVLQTIVATSTYDDFGNLTNVVSTTSGKKADGVTSTSLTQTVVNEYGSSGVADFNNLYGRLKKTTVTTQRDAETPKTRISDFVYETSGAKQGLLKTQSIQGGASTTYVYDDFGNKTQVIVTALNASGVSETRNTYNIYSTDGRYLTETRNDLSQSAKILARNEYGQATSGSDINNIASATTYYDAMGQAYMVKDPSGAWSRTETQWCKSSGVSCPAGAAYRKRSTVSGGGETIEYFDKLGRTMRSSKRSFDGGWSNIDTEYDKFSHVKRQSNPFVTSDSASNVQASAWTTTEYDYLGRPSKVISPDNSESSMSYSGYATTSTNAAQQKKIETRNGLGQLVKVTDPMDVVVEYEYDLYGGLLSATTLSEGKSIVVRMCYDELGRKTAMLDPDKGGARAAVGDASLNCDSVGAQRTGWWTYKYNGFSELVKQTDAKGQSTEFTYDLTGRMSTRTDKYAGGSIDQFTRWYYDTNIDGSTATGAKGKVTAIIANSNGSQTCTASSHCTDFKYDNLGRSFKTIVSYPDNPTKYSNETHYDEFGRDYEQIDPLQGTVLAASGTQNHYNQFGYAYESIDLNDGKLIQRTLSTNARGQITSELRGNGVVSNFDFYDATGLLKQQRASLNGGSTYVQNNTYVWDSLGNLKSRLNLSGLVGSTTASKNFSETFCYDGLNRLIKVNNTSGANPAPEPSCGNITQDVTYDGFGNVRTKVGVGTYTYGTNAGPHAVTNTTTDGAYTYDNNGNQISGAGRTFDYTSYDMVKLISKAANNKVEFSYGLDRARWQRIDTRPSSTTVTTYISNIERIEVLNSGVVEWKRYVGGMVFTYKTNTANVLQTGPEKRFIYNDHLGSVDVITDSYGKITNSESFDAWGARRNGDTWNPLTDLSANLGIPGYSQLVTTRGFTGHEMLDDMTLIHMNGRIYDQKLARFLQADPYIQAATSTQSYNRYSYVLNNPLNKIDPSGFTWLDNQYKYFMKSNGQWETHKLLNDHAPGTIQYIQAGLNFIPVFGWIVSAAFGANNAFYVSGGHLNAGVRPFVTSVVSYYAFSAVGEKFSETSGVWAQGGAGHIFAHAMVGGVLSVAQGGKFGNGFVSAGLTKGFMSHSGFDYDDISTSAVVSRTLIAAVVGGTISEITGGKFANGAITAAMAQLYNAEASAKRLRDATRLMEEMKIKYANLSHPNRGTNWWTDSNDEWRADCGGSVEMAHNIAGLDYEYSTADIKSFEAKQLQMQGQGRPYYTRIDASEAQSMDLMVTNGHMMFYLSGSGSDTLIDTTTSKTFKTQNLAQYESQTHRTYTYYRRVSTGD